jgi:hypothetical protein
MAALWLRPLVAGNCAQAAATPIKLGAVQFRAKRIRSGQRTKLMTHHKRENRGYYCDS